MSFLFVLLMVTVAFFVLFCCFCDMSRGNADHLIRDDSRYLLLMRNFETYHFVLHVCLSSGLMGMMLMVNRTGTLKKNYRSVDRQGTPKIV
jgi:hypothetical protein